MRSVQFPAISSTTSFPKTQFTAPLCPSSALNTLSQFRFKTIRATNRKDDLTASEPDSLPDRMPSLTLCGLVTAGITSTLGLSKPRLRNSFKHLQPDGGVDSTDPISVAKALGILTLVVAVHECGHFLAARFQNIHVSKFSIGFGPPLLVYQGKEVEYSIRVMPLGGFVAFPDDDPECPYPEDDPDLLRNRPIADRAIVISAGVIANAVFAYTILFAQASTAGITVENLQPGVIIPQVLPGSSADKAGPQSSQTNVLEFCAQGSRLETSFFPWTAR